MKTIKFLSEFAETPGLTNLDSKTVLITGASGGLGNVLIKAFLLNDYKVIAHTRTKDLEFESSFNNLKLSHVYADLSIVDSVNECFQTLSKKIDKIDVIIHNAGKEHGGYLMMTKLEEIKAIFDVNFFNTLRINQILLPLLRKSKHPSIINISSVAGIDLDSGNIAYGLSKSSMNSSTPVLSKDFSRFGIRVNTIAPGLLNTRMAKKMRPDTFLKMKEKSIRGVLEPFEIANIALFLSSEASSAINGQIIRSDGGVY